MFEEKSAEQFEKDLLAISGMTETIEPTLEKDRLEKNITVTIDEVSMGGGDDFNVMSTNNPDIVLIKCHSMIFSIKMDSLIDSLFIVKSFVGSR